MSVTGVNSTASATDKNTPIIPAGSSALDKNAFLKILTTELSNQDPDNAKDTTQYIAQLAQFSSLEQMQNLNTTIAFSSAANLVGKTIKLSAYDSTQNQYGGIVQSSYKTASGVFVKVKVLDNGVSTDKDFPYEQVSEINS